MLIVNGLKKACTSTKKDIISLPMAVYAVKKGNESNEGLISRWKKYVQNSGGVNTGGLRMLRKRGRFAKKPNKRLERLSALSREKNRSARKKKQFYSSM
jgi:hypothetical protein